MIDWEDLTKDDCVLCILRDKATKKAKRYEWAPFSLDVTKEQVKKINATRKDEYYEICDNEELRTLLPLPLSQRQQDLNDIYEMLRSARRDLQDIEDDLSNAVNYIDDIQDSVEKYIKTYPSKDEE